MSAGIKRPWVQVAQIANLVAERIAPYCQRLELAGSIRRRKPMVSDIELVVIPKFERRPAAPASLFGAGEMVDTNLLWEYLDDLMAGGQIAHPAVRAWGESYRKFEFTTTRGETYKVDVFSATPENWGNIFLIRTGSADFSRWMVTPRAKGGALPDGCIHSKGRIYQNGVPMVVAEEADWFSLCGLPFVPPEKRGQFGMPVLLAGAAS